MPLDADNLEKPFRKLRKSLKTVAEEMSPEEVHGLRTRTRRLEAITHALMLDQQRAGKQLLKVLAPIRKRAGKVRDMDVLTGFASSLGSDSDDQSLVQLLEHLGAERLRLARKLRNTIAQERKTASQCLKQFSTLIHRNLTTSKRGTPGKRGAWGNQQWPADAMAIALQLSAELAAWPRLTAKNLHAFRLKVKELRYVLQLADDQQAKFVDALGEVKDAIGEWHDWNELANVAAKALDRQGASRLLKRIRSTAIEKYDHALSLAVAMRKKYLNGSAGPRSRRASRQPRLRKPVIVSTAKLAA